MLRMSHLRLYRMRKYSRDIETGLLRFLAYAAAVQSQAAIGVAQRRNGFSDWNELPSAFPDFPLARRSWVQLRPNCSMAAPSEHREHTGDGQGFQEAFRTSSLLPTIPPRLCRLRCMIGSSARPFSIAETSNLAAERLPPLFLKTSTVESEPSLNPPADATSCKQSGFAL